MRPRVPKPLNPETESLRLEFANDLKDNDDFLASILVDSFGTKENTFMGVHYQSADFESRRPEVDKQEVFRIVKETVVADDMTQGIIEMMSLPAIVKYCEEKLKSDKARIKTFQEHLKRYLSLYSPRCRVEIKMTDRYSWHTGHPELAIVATRDLLPLSGTHSFGHRIRWGKAFADDNEPWDKTDRKMKRSQRINTDPLLTELTGGLAQLPYSMRKDIDDLDEHEYYPEPAEVIDLDAPLEIIESAFEDELLSESTGAESKVVEVAEEEVKMRDFSIVQSSRHGTMLFLGPGRFLNHDCEPNVKLAASGTRSKIMSFKVIKPIRTGEEIYTYYGPNYFGPGNKECLCMTCEKRGRGVFARKIEDGIETGAELSDMLRTASMSTILNDSDSLPSPLGRCGEKKGRLDSSQVLAQTSSSSVMVPLQLISVASGSDTEADNSGQLPERIRTKAITRRPDSILLRLDVSELTEEERTHLRKVKGKDKAVFTPVKRVPLSAPSRDGSITPRKSLAADHDDRMIDSPSKNRARRQAGLAAESSLHTMISDPWQKGKRYSKRVYTRGRVDRDENDSRTTSSVAGGDDDPNAWRAPRCTTCMVQCSTLVQIGEYSITLCERCTRHHRIFGYPWPARSRAEVFSYPPTHVRPGWWRPNRTDRRLRNEYMAGIDQEEQHIVVGRPKRRQLVCEPEITPEKLEEREARLGLLAAERAEELAAAKCHFEAELQSARKILKGILEEDSLMKKKEISDKKTYLKGHSLWRRYEYVEITEEPEPDLSEYAGRTRRGRTFGRDSASGSITPSTAPMVSGQASTSINVPPSSKIVESTLSESPVVTEGFAINRPRRARSRSANRLDIAECEADIADDTSVAMDVAMDVAMELLNDAEAVVEGTSSLRFAVPSPSELERGKSHADAVSPVRSRCSMEGTASFKESADGIAVDKIPLPDTVIAVERSENRPASAGQRSEHTRQQIAAALQENGLFPTSREREGGHRPRVILDPVIHQPKADRHTKRKLDVRAPPELSLLPPGAANGNNIRRTRREVPCDDFYEVPAPMASSSSTTNKKSGSLAKHIPARLDLNASKGGSAKKAAYPDVIVITESPDEDTFAASTSTPAKRKSDLSESNSVSPRGPIGRAGTTVEYPIIISDDVTPPANKCKFPERPAPPKKAKVVATGAPGPNSQTAPRRRIQLEGFHTQPEQSLSTDSPKVDAQAATRSARNVGRLDAIGSSSLKGGEEVEVNELIGEGQDVTAEGSTTPGREKQSRRSVPPRMVPKSVRHTDVQRNTPPKRVFDHMDDASDGRPNRVVHTSSKRKRPGVKEDDGKDVQPASAPESKMFSAAWTEERGLGSPKSTFVTSVGSTAATYPIPPKSTSQAGLLASHNISRKWGINPEIALGPNLQPLLYDTAFLQALSALTGHFPSPTKSAAVREALDQAMNRRIGKQQGSSAQPRLTLDDLVYVRKHCQCGKCRDSAPQRTTQPVHRPASEMGISPVVVGRLPTVNLSDTPLGKKATTSKPTCYEKHSDHASRNHRARTPPPVEQSPLPLIPPSSSPMALGLLAARNVFQRNRPWTQLSGGTNVAARP